jgi:catechol 2,3-dioxygenase-like lactoylglutathione lyase family enzyme
MSAVTIRRAVPNISSDQPAETREFFVDLLGFEVGRVVTLASPTDPTAQVTIIGNDDPAAPGISVEVDDVDAVHARAVELGLEIAYPLRDEEWGVRRFMLREPSGTTVNLRANAAALVPCAHGRRLMDGAEHACSGRHTVVCVGRQARGRVPSGTGVSAEPMRARTSERDH